jgi:two-component sensor histidine kinase
MEKDFAGGMLLLEELLIIRDSLLNEEKSKSLMAMHIRYETQKKEQEIALLEQREEINQARIHNNRILIAALIAGLVLFAVIGALIYINLKSARAAKARFELLLAETRHRIKNNLQTLASIFHLQTRHYTDHEMILEARSSESRVHTMSLLHERFYSNEANHIITTRNYITDLVNKIVDIYGAQTQNLKLSIDIDDVELDIDKALALSLIVQELMCNAFKYAFDHEPNPELSLQLHFHSDDIITTIHDNGIGFSGHIQSSNGLSLVNALVAQLDGKIEIYNDNGTTFIIRFPATSIWKRRAFS